MYALSGDDANYHKNSAKESIYENELTMTSVCDVVALFADLPSLTEIKGDGYNLVYVGTVSLKSRARVFF